jgi:hypothetical protein
MKWDEVIFNAIKDKRFWIVLLVGMIFIMLLRMKSPPIPLPEAAHNTIGDNPLLEQADDGYVSPIENRPFYVRVEKYENATCDMVQFGNIVSHNHGSYS